MGFDNDQLALLQELREQLRDRSRLYQSGLQQLEDSLTEIHIIMATTMNEHTISSKTQRIMATKAEEDLDPLKEDSDELVNTTVAPRVHGSATPPAKRRRSIKRKHHGFRSHSSKVRSGVVSSLSVDGKRFRSHSPLLEFQNLPQDRLCSCLVCVLNVAISAGTVEKQVCDSGRVNHVWKPGGLLGVIVPLIWLERFNSVDARILQTVKTSPPWATDFKDWRRMMGVVRVDNEDWLNGFFSWCMAHMLMKRGHEIELQAVTQKLSQRVERATSLPEITSMAWEFLVVMVRRLNISAQIKKGCPYMFRPLFLVQNMVNGSSGSGFNESDVAPSMRMCNIRLLWRKDIESSGKRRMNLALITHWEKIVFEWNHKLLKMGLQGVLRSDGHERMIWEFLEPVFSGVIAEFKVHARSGFVGEADFHFHENKSQRNVGTEAFLEQFHYPARVLKSATECVLWSEVYNINLELILFVVSFIHLEDKVGFSGESKDMWNGTANKELKKKLRVYEDHNWWAVDEYQETQSLSCVNELKAGSQAGLRIDVHAKMFKKILWSGDHEVYFSEASYDINGKWVIVIGEEKSGTNEYGDEKWRLQLRFWKPHGYMMNDHSSKFSCKDLRQKAAQRTTIPPIESTMRAGIQGYNGASWSSLDDTFSFSNLEDQRLHNRHGLSLYKLNRMEGSKREVQDVEDEVKKNKNSISRVVRVRSVMAMGGKMITGLHCFDYKIEEWLVTCQRFQIPSENITIAGKKKHLGTDWCIWLPSQSKRDNDLKGGFILVLSLGNLMKTEHYVKAVNRSICCRLTIFHSVRNLTGVLNYENFHFLRPPELLWSKRSCWDLDTSVLAKVLAAAAMVCRLPP